MHIGKNEPIKEIKVVLPEILANQGEPLGASPRSFESFGPSGDCRESRCYAGLKHALRREGLPMRSEVRGAPRRVNELLRISRCPYSLLCQHLCSSMIRFDLIRS